MGAEIPRGLVDDYLRLLHRYGRLGRILRLSADQVELFAKQLYPVDDQAEAEPVDPGEMLGYLVPTWFPVERARRDVEQALARMGYDLDADVLVALFPLGSVNAQARRTGERVLILIHEGLVESVRLVAKVCASAANVDGFPPLISVDAAVSGIAAQLWESFFADEPAYRGPLPPAFSPEDMFGPDPPWLADDPAAVASRPHRRLAASFHQACLRFVIGHEYGHLVRGHLEADRHVSKPTVSGALPLTDKSFEDEFEADVEGLRIATWSLPPSETPGDMFGLVSQSFAGALFFFQLAELVEECERQIPSITRPAPRDHPAPSDRLSSLYDALADEGVPAELLAQATAVDEFLLSIRDDVVAGVDRLVPH